MDHQDWSNVTFTKSITNIKQQQRKGNTVSKKRTHDENAAKLKALDDETDTFKIKTIDKQVSKQLQQARCGMKLSQKDLANKANLPVKTIIEYENGKAVTDHKILNKLKRLLKVSSQK